MLKRPFGQNRLMWIGVEKLLSDLNARRHFKVADLQELRICPDDFQAISPGKVPDDRTNFPVMLFDGHVSFSLRFKSGGHDSPGFAGRGKSPLGQLQLNPPVAAIGVVRRSRIERLEFAKAS